MLFSFVLPLAFVLPALANQLNPRGFWAGGGFGLSSKDCPSDTYDNCGTCCPNGFSMDDGCAPAQTWVCCPEGKCSLYANLIELSKLIKTCC